ncbi:hypothetical protein HNQ51_000918 [Inhella inkyongensis]|uniref:CARDB domain-containing protein n=1 Tax=Inhella inkyongensis TaxID=392593 RepID=A0A840S053_9BURK|nr:CARDB domain-containing protein [Inhella inkyongensis]MBB5203625.1 hypothetical protein [Inhella inkyongensis]
MTTNRCAWLALAMGFTAPAWAALGVDYAQLNMGAPPVLTVQGDAKGWSQASPAVLRFGAQARGKCAWGYRSTFVSVTLDSNGQYNGGRLASVILKDEPKSKDMTWSSDWRPVELNWSPSAKMRDLAVQACQSHLNQRVQAGQSAAAVLAQGHQTSLTVAQLGLHFSCDDYGITGGKEEVWRDAPVAVQCAPVNLPPPQPAVPVPGPAQFKPALQLTLVKLSANPENYQGPCPKDIPFTGRISSNGAGGELSYRFLRDGVPQSAFQPLQLAVGQGSAEVQYTLTAQPQQQAAPAQPQGIQAQNAVVQPLGVKKVPRIVLEVKSGGQQLSDEANYSFSCTAPPPRQEVPAAPAAKPDLSHGAGIQLGNQQVAWGGQVQLDAAQASGVSPHGCTFRIAYEVQNAGAAPAVGFSSRLFDPQAVLHHQDGMQLAAAASTKVSGSITLAPGDYMLRAFVDALSQVDEAQEGNNVQRVAVKVLPNCGGARPPQGQMPSQSPAWPQANPQPGMPGMPGMPPRPGAPASQPGQPQPKPRPGGPV